MNILLVDDDISSIYALTNLLQHEHVLRIASNGLDALNALELIPYNVVITDIKMPKMNGIELLKAIWERNKDCYVIILTGYPTPENECDAELYGAFAFFTKPINVEKLMEMLSIIEKEINSTL